MNNIFSLVEEFLCELRYLLSKILFVNNRRYSSPKPKNHVCWRISSSTNSLANETMLIIDEPNFRMDGISPISFLCLKIDFMTFLHHKSYIWFGFESKEFENVYILNFKASSTCAYVNVRDQRKVLLGKKTCWQQ